MLAKDCKSNYTSLALKMNKEYPFAIQVGPKATPLKTEEFCIACENGYTNITYNGLGIIQTGSCLNVLKQKEINETHFEKLGLEWKPKPTKKVITDSEYFFENKRASICPMTSCKMLKGDCKTPADNKNI